MPYFRYFRYFMPQLRRCSGLVSFGQRSSFWIVLHVSVTVELSSLCDEEMQDVQLENFLLMKEDASLEEAKQGQSKGKARAKQEQGIGVRYSSIQALL